MASPNLASYAWTRTYVFVSACMCLICLLATFRIGLRTPITFLRLDLNYIVVFNYISNKLDLSLLSLFKKKKNKIKKKKKKNDTFLEPGPSSWVKSGTKKRLLLAMYQY